MITPSATEISKMICEELGYKNFVFCLDLTDNARARAEEYSFKENYLLEFDDWHIITKDGSKGYKYVYALILEDGVVAVVGKTTFQVKGTKISGYNDLFRAYKGKELTAQLIAAHYKINIDGNGGSKQVDMKVKKAVIIPVNTDGLEGKTYDDRTKELEKRIGNLLVSKQIFILNGASHLH
ncbi:hypothetical protein QMA56_01035 [Leuconostoc falkenbergense]|uniref:hypothetical protein n=1 Tax=Leuconostoc falkenbergense TaxID=2766470 RepID=UPI0024AD80D7|nr:hypothetical protein [Leuconostoc falkenbergense]MDI6666287.1 hypothetical protein [Leuconostoc falkenbergense]